MALQAAPTSAKQSKKTAASSRDKFLCAGCVAAVRSAHASLGAKVGDEEALQKAFDNVASLCDAHNFEEGDQSRWSLPPLETSRACSNFVEVSVRSLCSHNIVARPLICKAMINHTLSVVHNKLIA